MRCVVTVRDSLLFPSHTHTHTHEIMYAEHTLARSHTGHDSRMRRRYSPSSPLSPNGPKRPWAGDLLIQGGRGGGVWVGGMRRGGGERVENNKAVLSASDPNTHTHTQTLVIRLNISAYDMTSLFVYMCSALHVTCVMSNICMRTLLIFSYDIFLFLQLYIKLDCHFLAVKCNLLVISPP